MKKVLFDELLESVNQAREIVRGERAASRELFVDAVMVKQLRKGKTLSQARFAALLRVEVSTLRNWEQGANLPAQRRLCCTRSGRIRRTYSRRWRPDPLKVGSGGRI